MRDPQAAKMALKPTTKMVFLETPSNPLMRLIDIAELSRIIHEANPKILVVVDNTFMTPYFQVGSILCCNHLLNGAVNKVLLFS